MYHVFFNDDTEHELNRSFARYNDAACYANLYDSRKAVDALNLFSIMIDNGKIMLWHTAY